jgi:hypothetical protein
VGLAGLPVRPLESRPTDSSSVSSSADNTSRLKPEKMPARKRPEKTKPTPPERDVAEKQDPEHTEADFLRDLEQAATNRSKELLADPSGPDRGSSRT